MIGAMHIYIPIPREISEGVKVGVWVVGVGAKEEEIGIKNALCS